MDVDFDPNEVITMNVRFGDDVRQIDVDVNKTVKDFKKVLSNVFGIPSSEMSLSYLHIASGILFDTVVMKFPNKYLRSLKLTAEDEFLVKRKKGIK